MRQLRDDTHLILDGEVRLYRRERSKRWQAAFVIDGHTIRISTGKRDLAEAKEYARDTFLEYKFRHKNDLPVVTKKFSDVAKLAIADMRKQLDAGLGRKVFADYIMCIERYLIPFFGAQYVTTIDYEKVQQFYEWRRAKMCREPKERDQAIYDYLERRSIPTVLAWASSPDKAHPFVGFDNKAAMRGLADMVIEMGHRRIGVISGVIAGNDRAAGRLAGIKESWQSHGFDIENLAIIETPYDIEGGGKAFEKLMAADLKPTVIMCGNDVLATGVISKAREMGLSVPDDVSVTGFDDIELARCVWPPLTTVHVPHRQMGREAANALIDLIEKRSTNISRELDVSIVMRGSLVGL